MSTGLHYPLKHVDTKGRMWHPYAVTFESPDGRYCFHIYAISPEHAQLQLDAIKENGRVDGQVVGVI